MLKTFAKGFALLVVISLSTGTVNGQGDGANDLMNKADKYFRNGSYNEALRIYSQAIKQHPNLWLAYGRQAIVLEKLGRHEEAVAGLNYWIENHPESGAWFYRSVILERNGKFREALTDIDRSCKLSKYDASVFWERATIKLCLGNYAGAREDAYIVLNFAPESKIASALCSIADACCARQTDAISDLGMFTYECVHGGSELHMSGKTSGYAHELSALDANQIARVLKRLNDNPKKLTFEQLGFASAMLEIHLQHYDNALRKLDQMKMSNQTNEKLLRLYCYLLKNDLVQADNIVQYLLKNNANSDLVMGALDIYFFEKNNRLRGISELKRLLENNVKSDAILFELAKVHRDLGQLPEALGYCDKALQLRNESNEKLLLLKANLLTSMNREGDALKVLSNVLAENKKCGAAFMQEAGIYTHQEQWHSAIQSLNSSIALSYCPIKALSARSACYAVIHQDSLSKRDAELVKALDPQGWQARLSFN